MFPFSDDPQELEGVAHRGDYDLTQHAKHSGKDDDLAYFDEELWNNDSQTMSTRTFKEWLKSNPTDEADREVQVRAARHRAERGGGSLHARGAVRGVHEDKVPDAKGNEERASS